MPRTARPPCKVAGCGRPNHAQGLCSTHYKALMRGRKVCRHSTCRREAQGMGGFCRPHERLLIEALGIDRVLVELDRLAHMVTVHPVTGCWLYGGEANDSGYARVRIGGKRWLVHRFLYLAFFGPQRNNRELDHLCNNPRCVRPNHLLDVTHKQNLKNQAWRDAHPDYPFWRHNYMAPWTFEYQLWAMGYGLPAERSTWLVNDSWHEG